MELKEINPKLVTHGNKIWCYQIDCEYCSYQGANDRYGDFGECLREEVLINSEGRCKSYEQ